MTNPVSNERHDVLDNDADPMIDALLVEFLSADADKRRRPPDLSSQILSQLTEHSEVLADRDPVVDVLLEEVAPSDPNDRKSPPDLTTEIVSQLAGDQAALPIGTRGDDDPVVDVLLSEFISTDPANRHSPPDLSNKILAELGSLKTHAMPSANSAPKVSLNRYVSLAVAIAACLVGVVWITVKDDFGSGGSVLAPENQSVAELNTNPDGSDFNSEVDPGASIQDKYADHNPGGRSGDLEIQSEQRPIKGIPLESPSIAVNVSQESTDATLADVGDESDLLRAAPLNLVAAEVDQTSRDYWRALGVQPTPEAEQSELRARLKDRLGVALSDQSLADPEQLRRALRQPAHAEEIAKRWLASTTGTSIGSISRPEKTGLVKELSSGMAGNAEFDVTLVSLINGSSDESAAWYDSIGRRGRQDIAKHLASVSMNADLRCVKCHDSRIGRSGTQDDYWSFVAMVRNVFRRVDDRWMVTDQINPTQTFYELPDGRQRLAQAKVSERLLQSPTEINDFKTWTESLIGSRALASSTVDSLWKLVHGRKLKPSTVDAFAPPVDEHLIRLHDQLAEDLQASNFDVARTLALIISSPMARRSVPDALQADAIASTSDQERSEALELVGAFAAAVDTPTAPLAMRLNVAMRRVGGVLKPGDQNALLAQPLYEPPGKKRSRSQSDPATRVVSFAEQLSVDFPASDASLPVAWLGRIDGFDQRLQHLVYLEGGDRVSEEIKDAADRFRQVGSDASALSRVWWILRN